MRQLLCLRTNFYMKINELNQRQLFNQLSIFKEEIKCQLIGQPREKFIHEDRTLPCKSKHQCTFTLLDGVDDMTSTFLGSHHCALIHR